MVDVVECVGRRCLVRIFPFSIYDITEVKVLEASPSGKYVKLRYIATGHISWKETKDVKVLEVLEPATEVRIGEVK